MKQNAKICTIGEQNDENCSLYVRRTNQLIRREGRDGGEGEERGLRKGAGRG